MLTLFRSFARFLVYGWVRRVLRGLGLGLCLALGLLGPGRCQTAGVTMQRIPGRFLGGKPVYYGTLAFAGCGRVIRGLVSFGGVSLVAGQVCGYASCGAVHSGGDETLRWTYDAGGGTGSQYVALAPGSYEATFVGEDDTATVRQSFPVHIVVPAEAGPVYGSGLGVIFLGGCLVPLESAFAILVGFCAIWFGPSLFKRLALRFSKG